MRWILASLGIMVNCACLFAAGGIANKPSAPPFSPAEAQNYAHQLNHVTTMFSLQYMRPVERADLIVAALKGLHETARVPMPASLPDEVRKAAGNDAELIALLTRVRSQVGDLEPLKGHNALLCSLRGLTPVLDPHSEPISAEEWDRRNLADPGNLGLEVLDNFGAGPVVVKTVALGGPAQRGGLRPGDQITHINGMAVQGMNDVLQRLRGNGEAEGNAMPNGWVGRPVELTVQRPGDKNARKVALTPEQFREETVLGAIRHNDNSWDYMLDKKNKIGYVRLAALSYQTAEEMVEALTTLQRQGMRGLILDLRWCPGGYLNEAADVAKLFVGEGKVAVVKGRDGKEVEHGGVPPKKFTDFPLLVLVNGETSGGGELIAAAIQDHRRGLIAGQRTRGKASVQTQMGLPIPNLQMKLSTGTFQRPNGKNLHRFPDSKPTDDWGVRPEPELEFRISADLSRQLRDWQLLQSLRPGPSNEALPLDDPASDPQRQLALEALLRQIKAKTS